MRGERECYLGDRVKHVRASIWNSTDMGVSIVQFTSSSCIGVLRVWVEVAFPSVENLKAGLPFMSPSF